MIKRFLSRLCGLRRDTEGASSIEFVVVFPAAMIIFLSTFEAGMYLTRQVFLDRGLDMAVRDIRL
ncbi:MAG: TadE family protein, partial [Pseudomonadota bacterium]